MIFWIILAAMTAVVLAVVLLPAMRSANPAAARASYDLQIYRDQLSELERDAEAGLIGAKAADAARNELARRIIAAEAQATSGTQAARTGGPNLVTALAVIAIPLIALSGYLQFGRPDLPDQPRAERLKNSVESGDMQAMVAQVETHLAANPKDAEGWLVLAPAYNRLGRFEDAAEAFRKGISLSEPRANVMTEYGETLVMANNGLITDRARIAFDQALALDPSWSKARFYRALADAQTGNKDKAEKAFRALLADTPKDAPWRLAVERQLAALKPTGKGPVLDPETVKGVEQMTAEDRQQMIAGMVERLSKRLDGNGDDLDGWLRLINARMVLGQKDQAQQALYKAMQQFKNSNDALAQLSAAEQRHGLEKTN